MVYHLFPIVCIVFRIISAGNGDIMERIPEMVQTLCPGADVCLENHKGDVLSQDWMPGFKSCCSDCSCQKGCQKTGDCCFPSVQYPVQEHDITNTLKIEESCLSLAVLPPEDEDMIPYKYNMVISVGLSGAKCGNKMVAPWGSFYPVFSKTKNRLYKNIECANLDDISDAYYFEVCLICNKYDPVMTEVQSFIENMFSNTNASNCRMEFRYPGNVNDLNQHKCYTIDSCPTSFTIQARENINLTNEEIVSACTSGLRSEFKGGNKYPNVFCYICNEQNFSKDDTCRIDAFTINDISTKQPYGYAVLVNTDFIFKTDRDHLKKVTTPKACILDNTEKCRQVFCSIGKSYNHMGQCNYPSKVWINLNLLMTLRVKTVQPINTRYFQLIIRTLRTKTDTFKSQWLKQWRILSIFSERQKVDRGYLNLLIIMRYKFRQIRPNVLMRIKRMSSSQWRLYIFNKTFTFTSDLSPFNLIPDYFEEDEMFADHIKEISASQYVTLYTNREFITGNVHSITKLFWCNHVDLAPDEFILSSNQDVILNLITRKYLLSLEFVLFTSSSGINYAKVCIEDSGLKEVSTKSNGGVSVYLDYVLMEVAMLILIQKAAKRFAL